MKRVTKIRTIWLLTNKMNLLEKQVQIDWGRVVEMML